MHWRRKWQPTPVFLPGESQGRGSLGAAVYGVAQSQTRLKRLSSSSSSSDYITPSWRLAGGYSSAPFWCLCQKLSLSPLYFNNTLLHKSSERSSLVSGPGLNSSPLGAKNPGVFAWFNNNLSRPPNCELKPRQYDLHTHTLSRLSQASCRRENIF